MENKTKVAVDLPVTQQLYHG